MAAIGIRVAIGRFFGLCMAREVTGLNAAGLAVGVGAFLGSTALQQPAKTERSGEVRKLRPRNFLAIAQPREKPRQPNRIDDSGHD